MEPRCRQTSRPLILATALALLVPASARAQAPLDVLATVGMIADIARLVGGECAQVETLVGPGADPHLFTPAPSDLAKLQRAELVLYGGLNLEGQLGAVLDKLSHSRPVVAVSEAAVTKDQRLASDGQPDPHVWMDPGLWAGTVPVIAAAIAAERPDCTAEVTANAAATSAALTALDGWVATSVATIPQAQRQLVTAHDAFAYFGRAYGLEVTAIQGISTASEAAIADIDAVAATVAESRVPAVFIESTVNPRTIQALIEAVAARGATVRVGGELYSDALAPAGSPAGTYIGMIRHNAATIVTALGGTPAPLPPEIAE